MRRTSRRARTRRVAILGTPRSGNSWVRHVLCGSLGLDDVAVHHPDALPDPLPERVVVQLHWYPTPELRHRLRRDDVRVVSVARHPLDVLVSILHFARHEPQVDEWLDGRLVEGIAGCDPTSDTFLRWATSERAGTLLGVTPAWWARRGTVRVSYEALVHDPDARFRELCAALGGADDAAVARAVADRPLSFFQQLPNRHGWQGTPGLWRRVLPAAPARAIASAHPHAFRALGYDVDPDPRLDDAAARHTWQSLAAV